MYHHFEHFVTAKVVTKESLDPTGTKCAEMGELASALYEDEITAPPKHKLMANGITQDVAWMVTDSTSYEHDYAEMDKQCSGIQTVAPVSVRTITLRGFDASDRMTDRELLFTKICTATPDKLHGVSDVLAHSGLLSIARCVYKDIIAYIDKAGPNVKFVLNGHSIGGSLSILLLLIIAEERGASFARDNILRVFTFGSPPVLTLGDSTQNAINPPTKSTVECPILEALGLPSSIVHSYIQPWDPFVRLFSKLDPISPIIVEMEKNSDSPNMSGPLLRSISRSLLQKCPGWPGFRTVFHSTNAQHYSSVGVQYILLPAPSRYAMDRTLTLNVGVPRVDGILCLSSCELLQALEKVFPLRAPNISNLLGIARSFFHHIPLAYVTPLQVFFKPKKQKPRWKPALYLDPSHGLTSLMDF